MNKISTFSIHHLTDLEKLAEDILRTGTSKIYALSGLLGAGKTTMIKSFCHLLGSEDIVQSPTFSIVNEYAGGAGDPIYHMDFYRINKLEEAFDLGYEDYLFSGNYCFIEWPELIASLLPPDTVRINIENTGGETREITVIFPEKH